MLFSMFIRCLIATLVCVVCATASPMYHISNWQIASVCFISSVKIPSYTRSPLTLNVVIHMSVVFWYLVTTFATPSSFFTYVSFISDVLLSVDRLYSMGAEYLFAFKHSRSTSAHGNVFVALALLFIVLFFFVIIEVRWCHIGLVFHKFCSSFFLFNGFLARCFCLINTPFGFISASFFLPSYRSLAHQFRYDFRIASILRDMFFAAQSVADVWSIWFILLIRRTIS